MEIEGVSVSESAPPCGKVRRMRRKPSTRLATPLATLAAAPESRVLAAWSGLGYYARARHLHRAAREIVRRHGGRFPREAKDLETLPGFGPYMAAAVASLDLTLDGVLGALDPRRVLRHLLDHPMPRFQLLDAAGDLGILFGQAGELRSLLIGEGESGVLCVELRQAFPNLSLIGGELTD